MDAFAQPHKDNNGFALVVVLFGLAVIGILFAVASTRSLSKLQEIASERILIEKSQIEQDILNLAIGWKALPESKEATEFDIDLNGKRYNVRLQDVGGLIDLNTASPELLEILFEKMGADRGGIVRFRDWRRNGQRLQRVGDILSIAGITAPKELDLAHYTTVYSGRRGVAFSVLSNEMRDLIVGTAGPGADRDPRFSSTASNVNFLVITSEVGTEPENPIGTIHFAGDGSGRRLE